MNCDDCNFPRRFVIQDETFFFADDITFDSSIRVVLHYFCTARNPLTIYAYEIR